MIEPPQVRLPLEVREVPPHLSRAERRHRRRPSKPRQNRVTPFGELIATESRGTLMGNRGCLHDANGAIRRAFANKRWISCLLESRGIHRTIMAPGRYTELFFLDEATALAAGHRPCAECQRARYRRYREAWATARSLGDESRLPSADEMDRVLHVERVQPGGAKAMYAARIAGLPDGAMVADEADRPFLVLQSVLLPWGPGGYGDPVRIEPGLVVRVLTPRSTVGALSAGYPAGIHDSAMDAIS
jgi:hypothetical protein